MQTIMIVCMIVTTAAIVTGTVFFVLTMVQVKRTAKELEGLARVFNMATPFLNLIFLGGGVVSKVVKKIRSIFINHTKGGKLR